MKLVVCSAGRPALFVAQTLHTILVGNVECPIHVVVPTEEVAIYTDIIRHHTHRPIEIHGCAKGLTKQRQYARTLFPPEEEILFMDDDIQRLRELRDGRLHDVEGLEDMARECFDRMRREGASLWSIYPVANRGWQSQKVQQDNVYCVGAFYGIRNTIPPEPIHDEKEDWARQLAIQAAGGHVLRFCRYGIQTVYWKGDTGGIQRTPQETDTILKELEATYGSLVRRTVKRNGRPDLRFQARTTCLQSPVPSPLDLTGPLVLDL